MEYFQKYFKEDEQIVFQQDIFHYFFVKKTSHQGHNFQQQQVKINFFSEMAIKQLYNYFLQERTIHPEKRSSPQRFKLYDYCL